MASDSFNWDVIIRLATQGAKGSADEIERVAEANDRLTRSGDLSEKQSEANSRALGKLGQSARSTSTGLVDLDKQAVSLRYANYDLASSLFTVSTAITALGASTLVAFASQESAFTEVERIVGGNVTQLGELRGELQSLSTEIPRSFQDLSGIAALGAALDIPRESLAQFTETVATFAAVTGVTEEAAASGFGRIAQYLKVPQEEFDALGSAILKAGNISVATEEQVLKFTQSLAPAAARIGFSTEQTVALGAAIASFGNINVEGAGSALSRLTNSIERSVATGGESLERFGQIAGMSAEQFRLAWSTDADNTFNSIIRGLSSVENLTSALDTLGIRNERDRRVVQALAQNYSSYNSILGETTAAFTEGTYQSDAYALVLDDLNSKWTIFLNAITNAAAAVGSNLAPALGAALEVATDLLIAFSAFAQSDWGQRFLIAVTILGSAVAILATIRGAIALTTGSLLAFRTATRLLGGAGILKGLSGLASAFGLVTGAAGSATGAILTTRAALIALGRATIVLGIVGLISEGLFQLGDSLSSVEGGLAAGTAGTNELAAAQQGLDFDEEALDDFGQGLDDVGGAAGGAAKEIRTLADYASDLGSVFSRAFQIRFDGGTTLDAITSTFLSIQEATEESARNIQKLKAEIQGLQSDIGIQQYFLGIAVEYGDTKRAEAIQANLAKLQADLADKTADLSEEQSKNSKELNGSSKAAINNRKELSGLVSEYQAHIEALAASGLSQEELQRRTAELRGEFVRQATQLGYNVDDIQNYAEALTDFSQIIAAVPRNITVDFNTDPALLALNEFFERAKSAAASGGSGVGSSFGEGFDLGLEEEIAGSASIFAGAIATASGDVKINETASVYGGRAGGAMAQALATQLEAGMDPVPFVGSAWISEETERAALTGQTLGTTVSGGIKGALNTGISGYDPLNPWANSQTNNADTAGRALGAQIGGGLAAGLSRSLAATAITSSVGGLRAALGFAQGGYTGRGGKYEPAGVVHRGEYVIPKEHVNQRTGLPNADALGRLQRGSSGPGYANGGYVRPAPAQSSSAAVALSAMGVQQFQQIMSAALRVYLDGQTISGSSAQQYAHQTQVGAS